MPRCFVIRCLHTPPLHLLRASHNRATKQILLRPLLTALFVSFRSEAEESASSKSARRLRLFTLLLAMLLSLTAHAQNRRPVGKQRVTIARIHQPANIVYLQIDVAKALHYFDEEGIEVRFLFYESGPLAAQALENGLVDFSCNSIDYAIRMRDSPHPLKMIASFTKLPAVSLVVRRGLRSKIRSVADLRGRRIGVSALGSGTHAIAASILKSAGIPLDAITIVASGSSSAMVAAIKHSDIDAAIATDPSAIQLLVDGDAYLLLDTVTYDETQRIFDGGYQFTGVLTRVDVLSRHPARVQKVVNALVRASRFMETHSAADIAAILPPSEVQDRYIFVKSVEHTRSAFSDSGMVTAQAVANTIRSQKALGVISSATQLDPADFFDMSFVNNAKQHQSMSP